MFRTKLHLAKTENASIARGAALGTDEALARAESWRAVPV